MGPYGGVQNLMLMRNDQNADTLVAMLGSCSPHMTLQQGAHLNLHDHAYVLGCRMLLVGCNVG